MRKLLVNTGLVVLGLSTWPHAWADTAKPCKTCSTAEKPGYEAGAVDKRFKFGGTPPPPAPRALPMQPGAQAPSKNKQDSIFGDGSKISKEFRVQEEKNRGYTGTRSVKASNGDIEFSITQDDRNPNSHAGQPSIFGSSGYNNGRPPGMPPGPTVDDLMTGNRNFRR